MTDRDREPVLTGGCQCGAVRYALYAKPEGTHICHCRMCQKAVGGPFIALAPVRLANFAWTRGEPSAFQSSTLTVREFCAKCGTPLTFRYVDGEQTDVTVGSLDRPADAPPAAQYGVESQVPWFHRMAQLPARTTADSMTAERKARIVNFQHPDHDTPADWAPPTAD
jgi:hypothetical protein